MDRSFYLSLAASGKRLPVATHLVLHEKSDPEAILLDGKRLAEVMLETARRFDSPLALPIMDLTLEKDVMLRTMGVAAAAIPTYHFHDKPDPALVAKVAAMDVLGSPRIKANCDSLAAIAKAFAAGGKEVPIGMSIGPFSLMTKLMKDPITPIYMAGSGVAPEDDDEVGLLASLMDLCEKTVHACVLAQIKAGAKAIFLCEPAANLVYFSPKQIAEGGTVYQTFVIEPNLRLKALFNQHGTDLIFHDCGSLTPEMIASFAVLDPVIISFGSPVKLWEAEPLVPKTTVLYGNLPTKKFYSDEEVPLSGIPDLVCEIESKLKASGHPFIIGSECDVLSMPGYEKTIMAKVMAFTTCGCGSK
ncbi:MAG: uroporphyrinogen decarboxylase family protein [Spirochaetales bacterium]